MLLTGLCHTASYHSLTVHHAHVGADRNWSRSAKRHVIRLLGSGRWFLRPETEDHSFTCSREQIMYAERIRAVIAKHARLAVDVSTLTEASDLYEAGLTSLTTVNLMLAVEDEFDIEFPDKKLGRKTFESIRSLSEVVEELVGG